MVQYKLDYFPARGRGEFIRYIFAYADVPYEDNTISFDAWRNGEKQSKNIFETCHSSITLLFHRFISNCELIEIPFGVIPRLLVDDKSLNQSMAIGLYLADKYSSKRYSDHVNYVS